MPFIKRYRPNKYLMLNFAACIKSLEDWLGSLQNRVTFPVDCMWLAKIESSIHLTTLTAGSSCIGLIVPWREVVYFAEKNRLCSEQNPILSVNNAQIFWAAFTKAAFFSVNADVYNFSLLLTKEQQIRKEIFCQNIFSLIVQVWLAPFRLGFSVWKWFRKDSLSLFRCKFDALWTGNNVAINQLQGTKDKRVLR